MPPFQNQNDRVIGVITSSPSQPQSLNEPLTPSDKTRGDLASRSVATTPRTHFLLASVSLALGSFLQNRRGPARYTSLSKSDDSVS
jgi:hypothetical protein